MEKLKFNVVGQQTMHCGGCESTVRFTLLQLPGVLEVRADRRDQTIEVDSVGEDLDVAKIQDEMAWIGYEVKPA